jgi:hypothetical protein
MTEIDPNGKDPHEPGAKLDDGKNQAGILLDFSNALMAVAEIGTFGANKYTRGGWQSVPEGKQRYTDAMMRHLFKMQKEKLDPDSGLPHLAHFVWNAMAVLELDLREEKDLNTVEYTPSYPVYTVKTGSENLTIQ